MKFGICVPNYGETSTLEGLRDIVTEAEKLGYESVWMTDHLLMPQNSRTPYERIFESITTLAYISSLTNKVRLGISSLIIAMRNPLVVAKQLATIDVLSKGRVVLAIGTGWNEKEYGFLGSNFHDRGKRVNDSIRLIRALWNSEGRFEGKYIPQRFSDALFEPKPVQEKLKIWVGGSSLAAMNRAAKLGDAWHPNAYPIDVFKQLVGQFKGVPGAEGKDICVRIGLNLKAQDSVYTGPQGDRRLILSSNITEDRTTIAELATLGVLYLVLAPNADGTVPIPDQIESLRVFAEELMKIAA